MAEPKSAEQKPFELVGDETCPWCGHNIATEQELAESAKNCKVCQEALDDLEQAREEAVKVISQDAGQGQELLTLGPGRHSDR